MRSIPGTLISLQRDAIPGDVEALSAAAERPVHDFSWVNESLPDALALLAGVDEYLAPSEWRWTSDDERSPWFRHPRVYRQAPDGAWATALLALQKELGG